MKILKPGKVEQRKFVCPDCECEFVATPGDTEWWGVQVLNCPCGAELAWDYGEPYEEPTTTQTDRERLAEVIAEYFEIGNSYFYQLTRAKSAVEVGIASLDDFVEFDDGTVDNMATYLAYHGVTFREG